MADKFFEKPKEKEEKEELVKLGDQEYKPEELQSMVEVAGKVKKFEDKSKQPFDSLTESWGKRGTTIGSQKKKIAELEEKLESANAPEPTPEEKQEALTQEQVKEQAKNLGIVTEDRLDKWFEDKVSQREAGQAILKSCNKMEKKFDGKDGRPAFKTEEVLEYMKETGIKQPDKAYKLKFESELDAFKEEALAGKKPSGLITEMGSDAGGKKPKPVKTTYQNLDEHVKEALYSKE